MEKEERPKGEENGHCQSQSKAAAHWHRQTVTHPDTLAYRVSMG